MQNGKNPIEYEITVFHPDRTDPVKILCPAGTDLLTILALRGINMSSICGGRGTCGKCRVQLLDGVLDISQEDKKFFTKEQLTQGWRLACKAFPVGSCTIKIGSTETEFEIITQHIKTADNAIGLSLNNYSVAVDIGTTTIAFSLVNMANGRTQGSFACINSQRAYGADVISRIQASNSGKSEALRDCITEDIVRGIRQVISPSCLENESIDKIVIACNTTMRYLLLGYSCETLGRYPYTPVNIETAGFRFEEVFKTSDFDIPVIFLPGISTFVGGDIVAGLLSCGFDHMDKTSILIDLGTNAEMAIGNKDRILVSSAAAGPAFEGGNILSGVGSISGAIFNIRIVKGKLEYETIGKKAPVGICGTGVIEIASELLRVGLVDETGLMVEEYFENGYKIAEDTMGNDISFTQQDIREIQLAKSAIRAGLEVLMRQYQVSYEDIGTVFLAGGFGYKINLEKAIHIGLLPEKFRGKILAVGNSSLGGAIQYLTDPLASIKVEKIIRVADEIQLSNEEHFNELYIEHMKF